MKAAIAGIGARLCADEKWREQSCFTKQVFSFNLSGFTINLAAADAGVVEPN